MGGTWCMDIVNHLPNKLTYHLHTIYTCDVIFLLMSAFLVMTSSKTKNPISSQPLIAWKWLTPRWKRIIKLHSKNLAICRFFADFLLTSALFRQKNQKWRHVTSRDVIMSDFQKKVRKCFFLWYYDVVQIWSHLHHPNRSYEQLRFSYLIWKGIGKL